MILNEDYHFRLTTGNIPLTKKPDNVGKIKTNITNQVKINFDKLKEIVLNYAFNCADARGPKTKDWLSQQVIGLDFDSGIEPQDVIDRLKEYEIVPNLIYSTYSDSEELRRFRVLFILDSFYVGEENRLIIRRVVKGLLGIFPEADASCSDICRMYYPGKEILYEDIKVNDFDTFENICLNKFNENTTRNYYDSKSREDSSEVFDNIKVIQKYDYEESFKIKIMDKFFNERVRVSYDILFGLATNLQKIEGGIKKMLERMKEINNMGGGKYLSRDINDNQRRGIEKYRPDYFSNIKQLRSYKYLPKMLENFSPFEEDYEYHNLLKLKMKRGEVILKKEKEWIKLGNAEQVFKEAFEKTLEKKDFKLESDPIPKDKGIFKSDKQIVKKRVVELGEFEKGIDPISPIYIHKVATGLGKTRALENLKRVILAFPTHQLKDEVVGRMKLPYYLTELKKLEELKLSQEEYEDKHEELQEESFMVTPEIPTFSDDEVNELIDNYRNGGLYQKASSIVKKIMLNKLEFKDDRGEKYHFISTEKDILKAENYIYQNSIVRGFKGTILTTHVRALYDKSFRHDTIIFDEDPLNYKIRIGNLDMDFKDFLGTDYQSFVKNSIEKFILNTPHDTIKGMMKMNEPKGFRDYCANKGRSDIIRFLDCDYIYVSNDKLQGYQVSMCNTYTFETGKNIIILSATAPTHIYEEMYKGRTRVIDLDMVEQIGIVEQYTKRSFSKSSILGKKSYDKKVWLDINEKINGKPTITHSTLKTNKERQRFKERNGFSLNLHKDFHFGNCSGGDDLNGEDICVLGTPNRPPHVYLFYGKIMGLKNDEMGNVNDQSNRIITYKGLEFPFYTFESDTLQKIHLGLVESDLIQAVGRNRTVRKSAKTYLYSSLPIPIATTYKDCL